MFLRLLIAIALSLCGLAQAQEAIPIPSPPQLGARGYFLMDATTGHVIAESRADERLEPASLTKIMTVYVALNALRDGRINLEDEVLVSEKAWRMQGSLMFIEVDTRVSVQNLLRGVIVQSGNDASVALAEHVAGSEDAFVDLMNQYAARLGMTNTSYMNTTGLPAEGHYSTARDAAKVARATVLEFPEYYSMYSEREFTYNDITQRNRNNLLYRDSTVDGLKTGHTDAAGYCLVSSAERDGMRLIAVVMGMGSDQARTDGSSALLSYGFRFYETKRVLTAGQELEQATVWKGLADTVSLGVADDLVVTVPRGYESQLQIETTVEEQIIAPLAVNQSLGRVAVSFQGEPLGDMPLIALQGVEQAGLWTRIVDEVSLWFD